jgi:hypothetical protein
MKELAQRCGGQIAQDDQEQAVGGSISPGSTCLKTPSAIADKLLRAVVGMTPAVYDALRYRIELPQDEFVPKVLQAIEYMRSQPGMRKVLVLNKFRGELAVYRGINTYFSHADVQGEETMFEIQFHTESSCRATRECHGMYKRIQELEFEAKAKSTAAGPSTAQPEVGAVDEIEALNDLRRVAFRLVAIPTGIDEIADFSNDVLAPVIAPLQAGSVVSSCSSAKRPEVSGDPKRVDLP